MKKLNVLGKKTKINILLITTALFGATAVQAADTPFYGRVSVGASIPSDLSYSGSVTAGNSTVDRTVDAGLDTGVQAAVALGFTPQSRPTNSTLSRFEVELAYRRHNTDGVDSSATIGKDVDTGGSLGMTTLFGNAYLDFNNFAQIQPYIGAGIGAAFVDQDIRYLPPIGTSPHVNINDLDTVFAAQVMAGVSHNINKKLAVQADVKYLTTLDFESNITGTSNTGTLDSNYGETSLNIGLRYAF